MLHLSSVDAFNSVTSKNLSFGKGLKPLVVKICLDDNLYQTTKFLTGPNLKYLQSSRSRKIVCESRINEIKHVQNEKPLCEFTHKYHRKKKRLQAR